MTTPVTLLPEDSEYLDRTYRERWSVISEGAAKNALLIEHFPLPAGFEPEAANLMILIPVGYPGSALDMFYLDPHVRRLDGTQINAIADESHFEMLWQRWSRHYKWKPGEDTLVRHVEFVKQQLRDELQCP